MSNEVAVTVQVPAAAKSLGDAIVKLVSDLKAKKSVSEVATDVLPAVAGALSDLAELQAELKDDQIFVLAGLVAGQLALALKAPAPAPAA